MNDSEQFETAFSTGSCGARDSCHCGRAFVDIHNQWDWEEGELDAAIANGATPVLHGVERLQYQGKIYCVDCDCWHRESARFAAFMRENADALRVWWELERQRLQSRLDSAPKWPKCAIAQK